MKATAIALVLAASVAGCTGGEGEGGLSPAPEVSGAATLPDAFPLPDDAVQTETTPTGSGRLIVQFDVPAPQGTVIRFYETALATNGWRLLGTDPTELLTVFHFAGNGWSGSATVVKGPPTQLLVDMNPEPTTGG